MLCFGFNKKKPEICLLPPSYGRQVSVGDEDKAKGGMTDAGPAITSWETGSKVWSRETKAEGVLRGTADKRNDFLKKQPYNNVDTE